ncbi:MAG UNVERIFIED_CONTAM: hypothetical protein LVR18_51605 [Planctomycetaceae bacterium]
MVVRAASNNFTADTFELDVAGAIEVLSQSISLSGADTMLVKGSLVSRDGSVTVESTGSLEVRNQVTAGTSILLNAHDGDLNVAANSRINCAGHHHGRCLGHCPA